MTLGKSPNSGAAGGSMHFKASIGIRSIQVGVQEKGISLGWTHWHQVRTGRGQCFICDRYHGQHRKVNGRNFYYSSSERLNHTALSKLHVGMFSQLDSVGSG